MSKTFGHYALVGSLSVTAGDKQTFTLFNDLLQRMKDLRGSETVVNYKVTDIDMDDIIGVSMTNGSETVIIHLKWGNQTCRVKELSFSEAAEIYRWMRTACRELGGNTDQELGINPVYVEPSRKVVKNGKLRITRTKQNDRRENKTSIEDGDQSPG